jgi:hypothetical protein
MKEFIERIVRSLVEHPDQVQVTEVDAEKTVVLEVRVAPDDIGKVIGKHGQNAKALRILLTAVSARRGKRAVLEILE